MMRRAIVTRVAVLPSFVASPLASCGGASATNRIFTAVAKNSIPTSVASSAFFQQRRPMCATGTDNAPLHPPLAASTEPPLDVAALNSFSQFEWRNPDKYLSPYDVPKCPIDVIILYNPSPHANNVAVDDLLRAWPHLHIVQTVAEGRATVVGAKHYITIPKGTWGDMKVFAQAVEQYGLRNRYLRKMRVGFYPVWSSMAEDSQIARAVEGMGLHWIGATPSSMDGLGKVEYKTFCQRNKLPTSPFFTVSPKEGEIDTAKFPEGSPEYFAEAARIIFENYKGQVAGSPLEGRECFVKSEYGGGGRGTKKAKPDDESVRTAIAGVLSETKKVNGIYAELALDLAGASLYQLEMEVDAGSVVDGGRLVYFNSRNQKMIELGFSANEITKFLPKEIFDGCTKATAVIARDSKYTGRGTNEILIAKMPNGQWQYFCSEFNKRVQVEHKALSNLYCYTGAGEGELFNTIADQVMRSCGYRPPCYTTDLEPSGSNAVGHVRLISPSICPTTGEISFPVGVEIDESILPKGFHVNALLHTGKLFIDTDAQFGVALIREPSWERLRCSLASFSRDTVILGRNVKRDYFRFLQKFFDDSRVADLSLPCNMTFDVLKNPTRPDSLRAKAMNHLLHGVSNTIVNGYRPDGGVKNRGWPTRSQIEDVSALRDKLMLQKIPSKGNPFLDFLGHLDENRYFADVRKLLEQRGGGMVSVFPRDVQQECGSSESHIITPLSRMVMERYGPKCGFLGYEQGGAQFQTAEMNGMNAFSILENGLLCNMPTWSLTRSHWMNALEKLNIAEVKFILKVTRDRVLKRFNIDPAAKSSHLIPYFPYNFHAGNVPEQDEVTGAMLDCGMIPMPNFVWDPRFTLQDFEGWVVRQLATWKRRNRTLHAIRIKNAGQQKEWTAENIYTFVNAARRLYREAYGPDCGEVIIHIHNHNFNGLASHTAFDLLQLCQRNGYPYLVVDTAPPLMTHNNNLVVAKALKLDEREIDTLHSYNEACHSIWRVTERFHDFLQVRIDPNTIWAGGTGSSDLAAAEKLGIPRSEVESAKFLGAQVSGLGGIVTPYSQWSMVIGYTCYKAGLKTIGAVTEHINNGGTLPLPKNILQGLDTWQTLLKRPALVDVLLANHKKADPAMFASSSSSAPSSSAAAAASFDRAAIEAKILAKLPTAVLSDECVARVLAYGDIAMKTLAAEDVGMDNNWLAKRPDVAYDRRMPNGKTFKVDGIPVVFEGIEDIPESAEVLVTYKFEGHTVRVPVVSNEKQKNISSLVAAQAAMADAANPSHIGAFMPGVCESIGVKVGHTIAEGDVLYSINSMKMVTAFKATKAHAGRTVEAIHVAAGAELAFSPAGTAPLIMTLKEEVKK